MLKALLLAACAVLATVNESSAKAVRIVCQDIAGMRVDDDPGRPNTWERDSVAGAVWTFFIDDNDRNVKMVLQNSRSSGGGVVQQDGFLVQNSPGLVVVITPLDAAFWAYSFMPGGRLLVTQHTTNNASGLSGKMMTGSCKGAVSN